MFFYKDNEPRGNFNGGSLSNMNATRMYIKHLENYFYLRFIELQSDNRIERVQATKELVICERKLKFWSERDSFDRKQADDAKNEMKKTWAM